MVTSRGGFASYPVRAGHRLFQKETRVKLVKCIGAFAGMAFLLTIMGCSLGCSRKGAPGAGVMAVVNGKQITETAVDRVMQRNLKGQPAQYSEDQSNVMKLTILTNLINNEILLQRAAKLGLTATDTEVENRLTEMKSRMTEEEFQKSLKDQAYTLDELKGEIRDNITLDKLVNKEITAKINITDAQIADYYQKHKSDFNLPAGYRVAHVLVANAPDENQLKARAQTVLNRIRSGEDFSSIAQQQSDDASANSPGGQISFVSNADLQKGDPAIRTAITGLKVGETSDLVKTKEGYWIIKLFEIEKGGQHDMSDPRVQSTIRNDLIDQKDRLLKQAFSEDARNEAKIVNYFAQRILESAGQSYTSGKK
ncbi:MAG: SurA N-terminal domain-containing protein [Acidobacteriia bacterium]|nr:SurA N-terminal domain-containing protein [Terriglobia bacterium]